MVRLSPISLALVALGALGASCATDGDDEPRQLRERTALAVIVVERLDAWQTDAMRRALARTGLNIRFAHDEHAVLMSPDLHKRIGDSAPSEWPSVAVEAWERGAAACRERAGRPPWRDNEIAAHCARDLGSAVFDALLDGWNARAIFLSPPPGSASLGPDRPWKGVSFVPDDKRSRSASARIADLVPHLVDGGGERELRHRASLPTPPALDDPALTTGPFTPFDAVQVGGCRRPLPNTLDIEPTSPMGNMIEHAWTTLSASVRTGPGENCDLRAFTIVEGGQADKLFEREIIAARIACPSLPLGIALKPKPERYDEGVIDELAKALVDQLAFGGCKLDF